MKINRVYLPLITASLVTSSVAAWASTGTDTVLWAQNSEAASQDNCPDKPMYTRPGRYSLQYVCGHWVLHKPGFNVYNDVMLVGLLVVGMAIRLGRRRRP